MNPNDALAHERRIAQVAQQIFVQVGGSNDADGCFRLAEYFMSEAQEREETLIQAAEAADATEAADAAPVTGEPEVIYWPPKAPELPRVYTENYYLLHEATTAVDISTKQIVELPMRSQLLFFGQASWTGDHWAMLMGYEAEGELSRVWLPHPLLAASRDRVTAVDQQNIQDHLDLAEET